MCIKVGNETAATSVYRYVSKLNHRREVLPLREAIRAAHTKGREVRMCGMSDWQIAKTGAEFRFSPPIVIFPVCESSLTGVILCTELYWRQIYFLLVIVCRFIIIISVVSVH